MFKKRLEKPTKDNLNYRTTSNGGWSRNIKGKPTDVECDVLSNCCGYANGRFNEIYNEIHNTTGHRYNFIYQAEGWVKYAQDHYKELKVDMIPEVGAIMCWESSVSDGHVAIVEEVISPTKVLASESCWNGVAFRTVTYDNQNGIWGKPVRTHKFLGFIHSLDIEKEPTPDPQSEPQPQPEFELYKVQSGDTFWDLAKKFYGDARKYPIIMEDNGYTDARALKTYEENGQLLKIRKLVD